MGIGQTLRSWTGIGSLLKLSTGGCIRAPGACLINWRLAGSKNTAGTSSSEPPSRWLIKTLTYLYGGFGSILFVGAILVFVSWKPLGQPPAVANLALAIVLVIVWVVQAALSWHQGLPTRIGHDIMVD